MGNLKKVSDEFWAGGQPSPEDLTQLAEQGFKAVVNLRSANEPGVLANEEALANTTGLQYVNVPLESTAANAELLDQLLAEVANLPTPIYFHCGAGGRASVTALIAFATQYQLDPATVLAKATELGIDPAHPQLQHFLASL